MTVGTNRSRRESTLSLALRCGTLNTVVSNNNDRILCIFRSVSMYVLKNLNRFKRIGWHHLIKYEKISDIVQFYLSEKIVCLLGKLNSAHE